MGRNSKLSYPLAAKARRTHLASLALVHLFLALLVMLIYWQNLHHGFVYFDDDRYVFQNTHVQKGLTLENVMLAFTTGDVSNWHPLTWISYFIDYDIWGLNPAGYHLTNLLLHLASACLLFEWLRRALVAGGITVGEGRCVLVAALFAVHPLHVESVAWIAERKDVLSTFFWFLACLFYVAYVLRPGFWRYMLMVTTCAFALMSKPMAVTLPFTLLLLDYWPLGRTQTASPLHRPVWWLFIEKAPLFALSLGSGIVTLLVQRGGGSVMSLERFPIGMRLLNASYAYAWYCLKAFWPSRLAVFYPHPEHSLSVLAAVASLCLLMALTVLAVLCRRKEPAFLFGWLWFLGTLVPVIGIVQVGLQGMADRYTYVPLVGFSIAVIWVCADVLKAAKAERALSPALGTICVGLLTTASCFQAAYWHDSFTLFERALKVTGKNGLIHYNLGVVLLHEKRYEESIQEFATSIAIDSSRANAHNNLGAALHAMGRIEQAVPHFEEALRIDPTHSAANYNLGSALTRLGRDAEALHPLKEAIHLDPQNIEAFYNLGNALMNTGNLDEAERTYRHVLQLDSKHLDARLNLGNTLLRAGRVPEAIEMYQWVIRENPTRVDARINLGHAYAAIGAHKEALEAFREAARLDPKNADVSGNIKIIESALCEKPACQK